MRKIKTDGAKKQPCSVSNGLYCIYIYEKAEHIIKKKQKGAFIFLNTIIRVMLLLVGGCDHHTAVIFAPAAQP